MILPLPVCLTSSYIYDVASSYIGRFLMIIHVFWFWLYIAIQHLGCLRHKFCFAKLWLTNFPENLFSMSLPMEPSLHFSMKICLDIYFFNVQFSRFNYTGISSRVEITRFELVTPCLQGRCSPNWAIPPNRDDNHSYIQLNGLEWTRTIDLTLIRRAL